MSDFRPYFSYWISFVHVAVMVFAIAAYGVGPLGFGLSQSSNLVMTEWLTLEQVDVHEPANVWVGPRLADLVRLGATFAPCMRKDHAVETRLSEQRGVEANSTGCCVRNDGSGCVQTTSEHCSPVLSTFHKWSSQRPGPEGRLSGPVCSLDPGYCSSPASNGPHTWPDDIGQWPLCTESSNKTQFGAPKHVTCRVVARPCCVGIHGQCELRSQEYCHWVGGTFHPEASLCSQISCLGDVCGMVPFVDPDRPDQFCRLWTSLFLNAGVIHAAISIFFQLFFMRDVEKMCGSVRMAVIFFSSGIMGNLVSAFFTPYRPEVGPSGALFGVLGTLVAEVLGAWAFLKRPLVALGQLLLVVLAFVVIGFLPWVDNYAHVAGFCTGLAVSVALLPQIRTEEGPAAVTKYYDILPRVILVGLFLTAVTMLVVFYVVPMSECELCKLFSCIPFTKDFCSELNINYERKRRLF